jgi:uncharacterized surface protein with fasciclin (FAS1) repeats
MSGRLDGALRYRVRHFSPKRLRRGRAAWSALDLAYAGHAWERDCPTIVQDIKAFLVYAPDRVAFVHHGQGGHTDKRRRPSMKIRYSLATLAVAVATSPAFAKDIVQTAVDNGSFKTLAAALQQAGLVDTLKGHGPFTVFAPTDAAFAKIPKAQLDALLADKSKLTKVLTYHVLPGTVMAKDVRPGMVRTVEGSAMTVRTDGGKVMVDNATVTATDVTADNGVIHVIDTVILPNS